MEISGKRSRSAQAKRQSDVDRALADLDKKILDVELRLLSARPSHDDKWSSSRKVT